MSIINPNRLLFFVHSREVKTAPFLSTSSCCHINSISPVTIPDTSHYELPFVTLLQYQTNLKSVCVWMAQLHSTNFSFQKEDLNSIMLHLERILIYLNRSKRGVQETTSIKCLRGDENWKKRQYKKCFLLSALTYVK